MVLWISMFSCSVPIITPEMPPRNPKPMSEMNMPENTGLPQGALRSHSKRPRLKPLARCATSIAPGIVRPWIIEASTAKYMK